MRMVAALFVQRGGVYCDVPGVDPWDAERDARLYPGAHPVVAHPPCAVWSRLAGLVEARGGAVRGQDGGSFAAALSCARRWGGVIEHPHGSAAWRAFGLRRPRRGSWQPDAFGDAWVTEVDQGAYGHRARKRTWLYACGLRPPPMNWAVALGSVPVELMGKGERDRTPLAFRDALLSLALAIT